MKRGINRALRVLSTLAGSLACGHAIIGAAISAEAVTARYAVMVLGPRGACNGAVLAQDLVLTAAHCTTDANLKILGMIDGFLYTLADVQEASAHPRFGKGNPATQTWPGMALLKLRARLPINFGPALLATRAVAVGDRLEIVGRVVTSQRGAPASESAGMAVFTVTSLDNDMLRLSDRTSYGEGSRLGGCRGFSGAPVFAVRGVPLLVGIVGGGECGSYLAVTPIAPLGDWLAETAQRLGSPLAP